jgi:hypothetical protein
MVICASAGDRFDGYAFRPDGPISIHLRANKCKEALLEMWRWGVNPKAVCWEERESLVP